MGNYLRNFTILVVEDETLVRVDAVGVLRDGGYIVLDAADSSEALQLIEDNTDVWVLFSDVDMPGVQDGLTLAHEVRRRYPAAHIIVTSGKALPHGRGLPIHGRFIGKPYCMNDVARLIDVMYAEDIAPLAAA